MSILWVMKNRKSNARLRDIVRCGYIRHFEIEEELETVDRDAMRHDICHPGGTFWNHRAHMNDAVKISLGIYQVGRDDTENNQHDRNQCKRGEHKAGTHRETLRFAQGDMSPAKNRQ